MYQFIARDEFARDCAQQCQWVHDWFKLVAYVTISVVLCHLTKQARVYQQDVLLKYFFLDLGKDHVQLI